MSLSVLMLGPGTSISHAAINILSKNGCMVAWVGEDITRFYAQGMGETYKAYKLIQQAQLVCDTEKRKKVVVAMYRMRFDEELEDNLTLPQIRGHEGVRMRNAYAYWSRQTGVNWEGRQYNFQKWGGDPINRALSTANAILNAVCYTVIVTTGYSPALGFIHQGRQLSFVYDIADLYKTETTIPIAFKATAESASGGVDLERKVRMECRKTFHEYKLMERLLPDIAEVLGVSDDTGESPDELEGRIVTLAVGTEDGSFSWEPERQGER